MLHRCTCACCGRWQRTRTGRSAHSAGLIWRCWDAVTWPDFLWDTLRVLGDPLGAYAAYTGKAVPAACSGNATLAGNGEADAVHAGTDTAEVCSTAPIPLIVCSLLTASTIVALICRIWEPGLWRHAMTTLLL